MDNFYEKINKIYDSTSYFEKYGGSVWMTILLLLVFFIIISYYHVLNNIQPLKADWVTNRCHPGVMPFAGIINKPDNMTSSEYTSQNFTYCMQTIFKSVGNTLLEPVYYVINSIKELLDSFLEAINTIRSYISELRSDFSSISSTIMGKILVFLIPILKIIIKFKDSMQKTTGTMTAGVYTLFGTYNTVVSGIGAMLELLIVFLITVASLATVALFIPFGFGLPVFIALLVIFVMLIVPLILVYMINSMVLKQQSESLPSTPGCFHEDTKLKMNNGTIKSIKNIKVGDKLDNNNIVTAKFLVVQNNNVLYDLNNVLVTGDHSVLYNNTWIKVKEHPNASPTNIYSSPLQCLNTSTKKIVINNIVFSDWDELDDSEINEIQNRCSRYMKNGFSLFNIHKYLDGGFHCDTSVEMLNGDSIPIKDVKIDDILRFGERVLGIVKIDASDLHLKKYSLNIYNNKYNNFIIGGPNLQLCDSDLGMISTLDMDNKLYDSVSNEKYIYHLITDKKTFFINGIKFLDYNACLDKYIDVEHFKLLKQLLK
jgi:hypothetical protein